MTWWCSTKLMGACLWSREYYMEKRLWRSPMIWQWGHITVVYLMMGYQESQHKTVKWWNQEATQSENFTLKIETAERIISRYNKTFIGGGHHNRGLGDAKNHHMEQKAPRTGAVNSQNAAIFAVSGVLVHSSQLTAAVIRLFADIVTGPTLTMNYH